MKKAAQILFLVSGILGIVAAVGYFIGGLVSIISGGISIAAATAEGLSEQEMARLIAVGTSSIGSGVWLLVTVAFAVVAAIVSFKARFTDRKPLFIVAIVFGALSMIVVPIVAGIFGLIVGDTLEEQKIEEQKIEE